MSLTSPATVRLMEALVDAGAQGAHREALVRQASISVASFYRALEPLQRSGLVHEEGGNLVLPLSHPHNYAFKLWRDQSRLLELPLAEREALYAASEQLQAELGSHLLTLWLVGSAAQGTLRQTSDLDLVAVARKEASLSPLPGPRPIQLTTYTEAAFRYAYRRGDNFLAATLTHGLVVWDRGFAQEFYTQAVPPPSRQARRQREERSEDLAGRVRFFLREEALEEARRALKALAVSLGRSWLEVVGELPAGKSDLVSSLELYFGPSVAGAIQLSVSEQASRAQVARALGELLSLEVRFRTHTPTLTALAPCLRGSALDFHVGMSQLLQQLLPGKVSTEDNSSRGTDDGWDAHIDWGSWALAVEFKSMKGKLSPQSFERLATKVSSLQPLLVIVNQLSELPPSQRPPLEDAVSHAHPRGFSWVDSRAIFQLFCRTLVEDPGPNVARWFRSARR